MILSRTNCTEFAHWLETAKDDGGSALIDKASGWTSFDVVAKLRNITRIKKVGHAGTLDPLAEGLLILCFGKATKQTEYFQNLRKTYLATVKLGAITKTDDSEGDEEHVKSTDGITNEAILSVINRFVGKILQTPPIFSAKKVNGKRLYKLAREEKKVEIKPVEVEIYGIGKILINMPSVQFIVECSKGTYIRSLARDIGNELGCGGYLSSLRRLSIGEYDVNDAITVTEFQELSLQVNSE